MSSRQAAEWTLVEDLTLREREILEQLADGKSDREIAEKLMLSLSTVKWHARQIYGKLGVGNRRMAVQRGQQLGLLGRLPAPVTSPDLPSFLTPFVGREQEMEKICDLLVQEDIRLVTLMGPGGIGKTRLAVQVVQKIAEQQPHTFADGICFVSLAGLSAAAAIVTAVGNALGVSFGQGINPQRRLCDVLGPKQMLLVLDNMEHLLDDKEFDTVGFVLALLYAAPDLRILATSRARLGVHGEQLYTLDGLVYPESAAGGLPDVAHFSALQLFLRLVQRVDSNYQMQGADGDAIGEICRQVEGMPLAIELAATWIRVMSCGEIAAELAGNLDFLSSNLHGLPPRHSNMRAIFERSWHLLSDKEQMVMRQLSVFRGGFLREAGEAVTGLTLTMLSLLVDRSLVRRQASGRFDLHELLRQFLAEKLYADPSERKETHHRHGTYYGSLFAKPEWFLGILEEETFLQIAGEIDNVAAAWQWAVEDHDLQLLRQLMNTLVEYHHAAGIAEVGWEAFDSAIAAVRSTNTVAQDEKNSLEASLLIRRSLLMINHQHHEALKLLEESLHLLCQSAPEYRGEIALAVVERGVVLARNGQNVEGVESIKEGFTTFQAQNHLLGMGYALHLQGRVELGWGRLGKARASLTEARRLFDGGNRRRYWQVVHWLASVSMLQGRYQEAETLYHTLINHLETFHPAASLLPYAWRNRGDLAIAVGNFVEAKEYFAQATTHFAQMGMTWHLDIPVVANAGTIARLHGELDEAERLLTQSLSTARQLGFRQRIAVNLHNLARLCHDQGRLAEEMAMLDEALQIARHLDSRFDIARLLCQLGDAATALKQEATPYYAEALQIATAEQIDRVSLDVLAGFAQQMVQNGKYDPAVTLLKFVQGDAASEFETKRKAHRLLVELENQFPGHQFAASSQQGEVVTLEELVPTLLHGYLLTGDNGQGQL